MQLISRSVTVFDGEGETYFDSKPLDYRQRLLPSVGKEKIFEFERSKTAY